VWTGSRGGDCGRLSRLCARSVHLSDLFDINKFNPAILEGDHPYGKDDFVEATPSIVTA
jgi:hypothetical protein